MCQAEVGKTEAENSRADAGFNRYSVSFLLEAATGQESAPHGSIQKGTQ